MKIGIYCGAEAYDRVLQPIVDRLVPKMRRHGASVTVMHDLDHIEDIDLLYSLPLADKYNIGIANEFIALAQEASSQTRPVINNPIAHAVTCDKAYFSRALKAKNIPTPDFVFSENIDDVHDLLERYGLLIIKRRDDLGGAGHYILYPGGMVKRGKRKLHLRLGEKTGETRDEFVWSPPYYAQQYISGLNGANDYVLRTYVVGNDVVLATGRKKDGVKRPEHSIVNIRTGARFFNDRFDDNLGQISLNIANITGFETGVVDFVFDGDRKPYAIEADCDGFRFYVGRPYILGFDERFDKAIAKRMIEIGHGSEYRLPILPVDGELKIGEMGFLDL
jgi:glutathione synthase/RimK-type ligase-like ATP-grasp enzyme